MPAAFLRTHQESMYFVQHKLPNKLLALINWEKSFKNYILRQTYEQKMIIYEKKSFEFSTLWLLVPLLTAVIDVKVLKLPHKNDSE